MAQWAEILTLSEACQYLRVDEATLLKEINAGRIPAKKFGNEWRIRKEALDKIFESPAPSNSSSKNPQPNKPKNPPPPQTKKVPDASEDRAKLYYADAIVARSQKQFDKARSLFEKAIKDNPSLNIFQTYAAMESQNKNPKLAKEIYERGLKINPKWGQLYIDYAMFTRKRFGDLEQALEILKQGLENVISERHLRDMNYRLFIVLVDMERYDEARQYAQRVFDSGMKIGNESPYRKFRFITEFPFGHDVYKFLQSVGFKVRIRALHEQYADLAIEATVEEYRQIYDLQHEIFVRCFFTTELTASDVTTSILDTLVNSTGKLDRDVCFIILDDYKKFEMALFQTVETTPQVILPIDSSIIYSDEPQAAIRQQLDVWLSRRDLFGYVGVIMGVRFYGRQQELQHLARNIDDGRNTGLFGLRKIGKTSLIYQLESKRPQDFVILIDLQTYNAVSNANYLIWVLADELSKLLQERLESTFEFETLQYDKNNLLDTIYTSFTNDIKRLIETLENEPDLVDSKIVIVIDELEYMLPTETHGGFVGYDIFFASLRGLIQTSLGKVVNIVAAANPLINEKSIWQGRDNPVFQFYNLMYLPMLSLEECQEMLVQLGRGMGVSFDDNCIEAIYTETGGHPYITRQLCSFIVKEFRQRPLMITNQMVWELLEDFLRMKGAIFSEILERLETHFPQELELFKDIARDKPIEPGSRNLISHLLGYQLIEDQNGSYKVKMKLLQRWIGY